MLLIAVMIQTPRVRAARRLRNANDERFSCRICYGDGQYSVSARHTRFYAEHFHALGSLEWWIRSQRLCG